MRRRTLQRKARTRQQRQTHLPRGFGPGLGGPPLATQPQRKAPGGQIECRPPGQMLPQQPRQQIPPRQVDPPRLTGVTAEIAIADQFRQCRLQRRVALPVDGGARLGHPP